MILKIINLEVFWFKIQTAAFLHPTRPISQHIYFVSQLNDTEGYQSWSILVKIQTAAFLHPARPISQHYAAELLMYGIQIITLVPFG